MTPGDTTPATGATVPFTITRQDYATSYNADGPSTYEWNIHFRTPSGVESFVVVPDSEYNAENVAKLVGERVAEIERVHALGQTPGS